MNITILTYGSRGDVQPFLPLSLGLMKRGHNVKLVAPALFKELIEGYGIQFILLAGDPEDLSLRFNDSGFNFIKMIRDIISHAIEIALDVMVQTEELASGVCPDDPEAIVPMFEVKLEGDDVLVKA